MISEYGFDKGVEARFGFSSWGAEVRLQLAARIQSRIQECYIAFGDLLCELVEMDLARAKNRRVLQS